MTTPNVPLLEQTLAHIKAHPEEWNQEAWAVRNRCGTAYCTAGTAVVLAGARVAFDDDVVEAYGTQQRGMCTTPDGKKDFIGRYARKVLGLTWAQSLALFDFENSLADLERIVNDICNGDLT